MMTDAEKSALRSLQDDLFDARAAHAHELRCNADGLRILGRAMQVVTKERDEAATARALCALIDEATAALGRRREQ